jgi:hypothetical protein
MFFVVSRPRSVADAKNLSDPISRLLLLLERTLIFLEYSFPADKIFGSQKKKRGELNLHAAAVYRPCADIPTTMNLLKGWRNKSGAPMK